MKQIALAFGISVLLAGCAPQEAPPLGKEAAPPPPEAVTSLDFSIPNLAGEGNVQLSSYKGQVVLLDFWATWCPPCRFELPLLNKMYQGLKDKGFTIIGMTVDHQGSQKQIADKVKRFELTYPVGWAGPEVQSKYGGIRAVPTKFLLDKKGAVRKHYEGVVPEAELRASVDALLAE